jgi:hypothetical protein
MTPALRLAGRKVSQTGSAAEAQHAPPVNSDDSLDWIRLQIEEWNSLNWVVLLKMME